MNNKFTIFISWSQSPAEEIAGHIKELLENIFTDPNIEFFLSSSSRNGIVAGERFRNKLDNKLMDSNFGILVLTSTNFERPWMMFESGALSKNTEYSRVVPIIIDRDNSLLESPIKNFQYVKYDENGFRNLVYTIKMSQFNQSSLLKKQKLQLDASLVQHWDGFSNKVDASISEAHASIANISENVTDLMMDEDAYENILPRRELQLEELISNLSNDRSKRIIVFGGISTVLRKEETIRKFVSWLTVNKDSKLFICYENQDVAAKRADELSDNAYSSDVNKTEELNKRKVVEFGKMKDTYLSLVGTDTLRNLYFVEISKTLTNYTTIQGATIFLTPVLNKRASNTFTFKLKSSSLNLQVIEYIASRLESDDKDRNALITELGLIKAEVANHE